MYSFDLQYHADDDCLEVVFDADDGLLVRNIELTDTVVLYSTALLDRIWGLSIGGYAEYGLSGAALPTNLTRMSEADRTQLTELLTEQPVALFLRAADENASAVHVIDASILMLTERRIH